MKVSIHQPVFLPWFGFFSKLIKSDKFVIFDNVYAPLGKSWLTRNKILMNGNPLWITLPVYKGKQIRIKELKIANDTQFKRKHLGSMKSAYGKATFFPQIFEYVESIYNKKISFVSEFNMELIFLFVKIMKIKTKFVYASDLMSNKESSELFGNEMVLEIAKRAGATVYYSGTGCTDFIQPEEFEKKEIKFFFNNFQHPKYRQLKQRNNFITNMSLIDALFNLGPNSVFELLIKS